MGDDPFMGQEIGLTGGDWGFREFRRIRYITPLGVPVEQVRILQYNHNWNQHLLGQQVREITKALDAVVNFSNEYAHEVNGAIGETWVALSTLRIEIQAHAEVVLIEGRGVRKIVNHNHQQIDDYVPITSTRPHGEPTECCPTPYSSCHPPTHQCHHSGSNMRRCQEVLTRLGVHGASLTATVSRGGSPVEHTHVNESALVPDTSVSTDLALHPSLCGACDTALHSSLKGCVQAPQSPLSTLEQCDSIPHSESRGPLLHNNTSDTGFSPGCPLFFHSTTLLPPPPQVHKPLKPIYLRPPPPSLHGIPAIRVVSFKPAESQNTPASIFSFLNEGYDVILLQELNSPPLLPQRYAFGNDRAKVCSNVFGHKHGVSVIPGPRIVRYTSCISPKDSDSLICGAKISLPEATLLHVFSVYFPPVRTGAPAPYRDTIERVLASYCNEYPYHILRKRPVG